MNLEYRVIRLYQCRRFDKCIALCQQDDGSSRIVQHILMRAMTIQVKVAGNYYDESYYPVAESLEDSSLAKTPRPGTALQRETITSLGTSASNMFRANTATVRARTGGGGGGSRSARNALSAASRTARAATALSTGGNAAVAALPLTLFSTHLDFSRAKTLFEYVLFSEGDVRKAMEIVSQAQKRGGNGDWWWNFSAAQCHMALGLKRNAEECLRLALKQSQHISVYLRLVSMYVGLNQPLSALQMCESALTTYPNDATLRVEQARIHDAMGNPALAIQEYRQVALQDPNNMEAIASLAHYNFYNDQPEIALRYYRRLLATTPPNSELFNNVGLCCVACSQLDLVVSCFRHALFLATSAETRTQLWFNLAHVALMCGDVSLAQRCLQASLTIQADFQPAVDTCNKLNKFILCHT